MSEIQKQFTLFKKSEGGWGVFSGDDLIAGIDGDGDLWPSKTSGVILHEQLFEIAEFIKEHCNPRWTPQQIKEVTK